MFSQWKTPKEEEEWRKRWCSGVGDLAWNTAKVLYSQEVEGSPDLANIAFTLQETINRALSET